MKLCFSCTTLGGEFKENNEITNIGYFPMNKLPELSEKRITRNQIAHLYQFLQDDVQVFVD